MTNEQLPTRYTGRQDPKRHLSEKVIVTQSSTPRPDLVSEQGDVRMFFLPNLALLVPPLGGCAHEFQYYAMLGAMPDAVVFS